MAARIKTSKAGKAKISKQEQMREKLLEAARTRPGVYEFMRVYHHWRERD